MVLLNVPSSSQAVRNRNEKERFTFFHGGTFSHWAWSRFTWRGYNFVRGEQAMMWFKANMFGDSKMAEEILKCSDPQKCKNFGKMVRPFDDDRWRKECIPGIIDLNRAKYTQNPKMLEELLATRGTTLVEASQSDRIWGIGLRATDPRAQDRTTWRGLNRLGDEVLTPLREELDRR